ncbi:MAG TPA: hypothetical protein PK059_13585 [Cyclobacteriaceae bacterium]|nr:hypothetical protein [Cyclobacteriaceae bacterium]
MARRLKLAQVFAQKLFIALTDLNSDHLCPTMTAVSGLPTLNLKLA